MKLVAASLFRSPFIFLTEKVFLSNYKKKKKNVHWKVQIFFLYFVPPPRNTKLIVLPKKGSFQKRIRS